MNIPKEAGDTARSAIDAMRTTPGLLAADLKMETLAARSAAPSPMEAEPGFPAPRPEPGYLAAVVAAGGVPASGRGVH